MTKREGMEIGGKLQLTVDIVAIQGVEWPLIEVQPTTGRHVVGLLMAPALYEAAEYTPPERTFEFGDWVRYYDQRHGRVVRSIVPQVGYGQSEPKTLTAWACSCAAVGWPEVEDPRDRPSPTVTPADTGSRGPATHDITVTVHVVDEQGWGPQVAQSRLAKVLNQLPPGMTWRLHSGERICSDCGATPAPVHVGEPQHKRYRCDACCARHRAATS